jgi:uncharacterized protein YqjF (DUF2071 family)
MHRNASELAKVRLLQDPREPLLFVDWEQVVFLHFKIPPEVLCTHIPTPFQLELWRGEAWLSVVALTMRRFRPGRRHSFAGLACGLRCQRFLNFRTYVSTGGESGAYFLHGWLSRPWGLSWPSGLRGFPYALADLTYEGMEDIGRLDSRVSAFGGHAAFAFRLSSKGGESKSAERNAGDVPSEFLLERYSGFFVRRGQPHVFRTWHPPWLQVDARAEILDTTLIGNQFPWFREAKFAGAHYAQGFKDVWLGRLHRLDEARRKPRRANAFFEMP